MFSSRLPHDLSTNPLTRAADALRARGEDILDLTLANPTRAGLRYPYDAVGTALARAGRAAYAPDPRGTEQARTAIARYYRDSGSMVDPSRIHCTASTSEAYGMLFRLLCDPGDAVCVAHPAYPLFAYLAALEGVQLQSYHLRRTPLDTWRVSFPSLEEAITERTRAVVVVHPSNPTGNYLDTDELQRLEGLCAARGLALIVDEVFFDYSFEAVPRPRSVGGNPRALRFTLNGISKLAGLPQLKLGWIITEGPDSLRREAAERLDVIADATLGVSTPVMEAAGDLLALRTDMQAQIRARCADNLQQARHALGERVLPPEGGWNALIALDDDRESADEHWALTLLQERQVLVHPGYLFDFPAGAWAVVSLLPAPPVFAEAMRRIAAHR